jgi:hypothetical protein
MRATLRVLYHLYWNMLRAYEPMAGLVGYQWVPEYGTFESG